MKSEIVWTILSNTFGERGASKLVSFFGILIHRRDYYDEAMEYREQFFSQTCFHCGACHSVDANFCPSCGQKILSEEEHAMLLQEQTVAAWCCEDNSREETIAREEAAAWAAHRRELEMVHH